MELTVRKYDVKMESILEASLVQDCDKTSIKSGKAEMKADFPPSPRALVLSKGGGNPGISTNAENSGF
jgi:hypothetical protein